MLPSSRLLYNGRRRAGLVGVVALLTCVQLGAPGSESLLPQSQHQSDPPTVQHSVSRRRTAPSVHLCRCSPSTLAASLGGNSSLLRSPASSLCVGARALFAQSTTLTRQIRSECRHRARHGRGHALWSIRSEGRDRRGGSHAPPIRGAPARYSSRYSVESSADPWEEQTNLTTAIVSILSFAFYLAWNAEGQQSGVFLASVVLCSLRASLLTFTGAQGLSMVLPKLYLLSVLASLEREFPPLACSPTLGTTDGTSAAQAAPTSSKEVCRAT